MTDARQPNILFLFADDQAFDTLGKVNGEVHTPNLDRLLEQGVLFSHTFNQGSFCPAVCIASRAMLLTGQTLWRSAEISRAGRKPDPNLPAEAIPPRKPLREPAHYWPKLMKDAGYETYFSGKFHLIGKRAPHIFDHVGTVRAGMPSQSKARAERTFEPDQPDPWSPYDKSLGGYWEGGKHWSEVLADESIDFIEQAGNRDNPFFMYLAFNAPHDPRQSPKEFVDKHPLDGLSVPPSFLEEYPYSEAAASGRTLRDEALAPFPRTPYSIQVNTQEYYGLISHMDSQIGRILDALDASGMADNTIVIFTADQGLSVGDHGFMGKQNMYERSMRVPMIMKGPSIPAGRTVDELVYLQDVVPTTLNLAGATIPEDVEFEDLMPLVTGKGGGYEAIYGAYLSNQRMVRTPSHKMILYPTINKVRLYDLENDPWEMNDLAEDREACKPLADELLASLLALQKEYDDPVSIEESYQAFFA